jgi:hypothetical protein
VALGNASDQFFEWAPTETGNESNAEIVEKILAKECIAFKADTPKQDALKAPIKFRPRFVVEAVSLLASGTSEGKVALGQLGQYLKRTDPDFSPQAYGHSGLLDMLRTYDFLESKQEDGGHWSVRLARNIPTRETV